MINTLRPFIKLMAWQWKALLLGFGLSLLGVLAAVALLSLSGWLICAAAMAGLTVAGGAAFNYFIPTAGVRFFALLRILTRYGERVINHNATFSILRDLRSWCYRCIEPLAPAHFSHYQSGDLIHRLVSDVDDLDNLYLRVLSPLLIACLLAVVMLFFVSFYSVSLAWIIFSAFAVTLLLSVVSGWWFGYHPGIAVISYVSSLRKHALSNLQGHMDVVCYGLKSQRLTAFSEAQTALAALQLKLSLRQGAGIALVMLVMGLTTISVLLVGIPLVNHHDLNAAVLGMITILVLAAFEVIIALPGAFQAMGKTTVAATRVSELMNTQPTVRFAEVTQVEPVGYKLHLDNISFHYPGQSQPVLFQFNLHVPERQRVAIVGASGAGKSTLAHLLVRSWDPMSGRIMLGGNPLTAYTEAQLRQLVSVARQQTHIFNATVRENLLFVNPNASEDDLWQALKLVLLDDIVKTTREGLDTEMGEFGQRFSGGQIKRMGIARAILSPAPIIILDEPSEGLDANTYQRVWHNISSTLKDKSLIVITHNQQQLQAMDQVVSLGLSY